LFLIRCGDGPARYGRSRRFVQTFQPHVACRPKQVRADLADLEWRDEYAVRPPGEQPGEVGLAQAQG
jgi:hypothetical protein